MVEDIKVTINLVLQFEDKFPMFDILLDGNVLYSSNTKEYLSNIQTFDFYQTLSTGPHQIDVKYREVPEAMTNVEIAGIAFNDHWVRQDYLITRSIFYTESPTFFDGNTVTKIELYRHLGITGTWQFKFFTPLVTWAIMEGPYTTLGYDDLGKPKYAIFVDDKLVMVENTSENAERYRRDMTQAQWEAAYGPQILNFLKRPHAQPTAENSKTV